MRFETLLVGIPTLALWSFVWYRALRCSPFGWISPICLFALGLMAFYIIPSLYWQFRVWNYSYPPYYEGLPLTLIGAGVLGVPFILSTLLKKRGKGCPPKPQLPREKFGGLLWVLLIPVLIGVGWRIFLLTMGWQSRLARETPTLLGSASLASIVYNFSCNYTACYFGLVAFGKRSQRRVGVTIMALDGLLSIYTLHRYEVIRFLLYICVFATLLGVRLKPRYWIALGGAVVFTMAIIGHTSQFASQGLVQADKTYLTVSEGAGVFKNTLSDYVSGEGPSVLMKALDDTMFRFYDARSASAVMMSIPDVVPYAYGKTLLHILYAYIPRYFYPEKPDLGDIHRITDLVMYPEPGNSAGTLVEFYMNFGLFAVFMGGIVCFYLCKLGTSILSFTGRFAPAWLCMYPILSEQYVFASYNFSQRICEGLRGLLVLVMIALLLRFSKKRPQMKNIKITRLSVDILNSSKKEVPD